MAEFAVRFKAVVLLLLNHCLLLLQLFVGFCVLPFFCYAVLIVLFNFVIILMGKRAGYFTLNVFLMACVCKCSLVLPHDAVDWSEVCGCGIF